MTRTAALLIPAALVAGLFGGAMIGRNDLDYWKDRVKKDDLTYKALTLELADLRKRYTHNLSASMRNQQADINNKRKFETLVEQNAELREGLQKAIQLGMEAERNAMLWRNKCGGAK